ncbi:MAG: signal peptidase I [Vicinamibacteria bacterium]
MNKPLFTDDEATSAAPTASPDSTPATDVEGVAAARTEVATRHRPLRHVVDLLHDLTIAVVVCALLITYVVQAFKVQGTSMSPELVDGERILVNKFVYNFRPIERGDVVVFWYTEDPDVSFIKRVVGLPGDTVEIIRGEVLVNGEPLSEPYVEAEHADRRNYQAEEVRPGHYFVLGDNRRGSNDSRSWGLVPRRYIYGKAFLRIWPPDQLGFIR